MKLIFTEKMKKYRKCPALILVMIVPCWKGGEAGRVKGPALERSSPRVEILSSIFNPRSLRTEQDHCLRRMNII